jgi:cellulose synthase/poly-beta-1,6-N-acetylglucosamine synthase-like glycosyltransferase
MLTRALALSVLWLAVAMAAVLARGAAVRRRSPAMSFLWLLIVLLAGDCAALISFGRTQEIVAASLIALVLGAAWIALLPNWNALGHAAWSTSVIATVLFLAHSFAVAAFTPQNVVGFLLSFALALVEVFALLLSLTFLYETLDVCTRVRWNRVIRPQAPIPGYAPKVSLHVPAYNEPALTVEQTLRSLGKLDYPNFEVLLIDNNTPDPTMWKPLEAVCRELGPNFKMLHLDHWPGYKSGALNFALTQTALDAEIIGVIDADYLVQPSYLRELVPLMSDPRVAFVQTPQDYRAYERDPYLETCYDGYRYFFEVPMPSRNEHNAIIFGGTMGLIRKSVLQEIGGWDEWCITEDAEASLRILKLGYESIYVNRTYGQGIMPLNFDGLKRQRFRWCFGGIQILRKHWEALMPWARWVDPANRLTGAQRYYYLASSLQWFNELSTMIFTALLLIGAASLIFQWGIALQPLAGGLVVVPLVSLSVGLWRFLWALRQRLGISWKRAARAMFGFFSLSWVVALATVQGMIQPQGVFLRTPKASSKSDFVRALTISTWEVGLGTVCALAAIGLALGRPAPAVWVVALFLLWQGAFYFAAPAYSLMSERGKAAVLLRGRADIEGRSIVERRAATWAAGLVSLLLIAYAVVKALPQPNGEPVYAQWQPATLPAVQVVPVLPTETPTSLASPTAEESATPASTPSPTLATDTATPSMAPTEAFTATIAPTEPPSETPVPTALSTDTPLPPETATSPRSTQAPTQKPLPSQVPTHPSPQGP